jgi:DNA-binding transcriptional LysR family regulator
MINFTHLLAFYEVAKAGSVSAGAERLRVSQPAVTREIRELEERHGIQLFDRLPRGVALTEAGKALFAHAAQIFAMAGSAESHLRELAGLSSGHVKIIAGETLGVYVLPKVIARFSAAHPNVAIDLMVADATDVVAGLRSHAFTLGFVEGPYDDAMLEALPIGSDEIALVARPVHSRVGTVVSPRELTDRAVIMQGNASAAGQIIEAAFARKGLNIEPAISVSGNEAIKKMLISERAVAYVSLLSVAEEINRDELCVLEVEDLRIEQPLHMVWLKGRSLSPSARAFQDVARNALSCSIARSSLLSVAALN